VGVKAVAEHLQSGSTCLGCFWTTDRSVNARRVLAVLAGSQLAAMAPWFSASAVTPALSSVWRLDTRARVAYVSVQLGFVVGALVSALLSLSDRWSARRLVAACACLAGLATLGVAFAPGPGRRLRCGCSPARRWLACIRRA